MREFGYHVPGTLDEAIALLEGHEANACRGGAVGLRANPAVRASAGRRRVAGKRPKVVRE